MTNMQYLLWKTDASLDTSPENAAVSVIFSWNVVAILPRVLQDIEWINVEDKFAVSVTKNDQIVGHIPKENSMVCHFFIKRGGSIRVCVTGKKVNTFLEKGGGRLLGHARL